MGVVAGGGLSTSLAAEHYPSRVIKLVVAFAPGGDGTIGMGEVVRAAPDGYTLLIGGFGGQIIPPLMKDDFPFDVRRDIVKIALTAEFANVVVVNKDLPISSAKELVDYAKARPGALNFGSSGRATSDRLAAELFMLETGTRMVNVPYKGGGVALTDLRAGVTQVMFPQLPAVIALATSGDVKPLAVTSRYRLAQLPDVPTLSESLLPDFHVTSWNVVLAPKGLPDDIRKVLSDALVQAVKDPSLQEKMRKLGIEPVGMASAEADVFFEQELVRWKKVIDTAGIKLEH
jgi:tripartite-type tricarboxylate transporter receptor subunit TctC